MFLSKSAALLGWVVLLWGCNLELGQLGGVTTGPGGHTLGNVEVNLGPHTTTTNVQGQYLFEDLLPGSYRLLVSIQGYAPHEAVLDVAPGAQRVDVILTPTPDTKPAISPVISSTPEPASGGVAVPEAAPAAALAEETRAILTFKLPLPGGYDWLLSTEPGGGFYGGGPNTGHTGRSHFALDIIDNNAQQGELNGFPVPVLAAADGVVVEARNTVICQGCEFGYGNYAKLDHGGGFTTTYSHLRYPSVTVRVGERVRQGQVLGFMGNTGHSTGIHLHFEFRYLNEGAKQAGVLNRVWLEGLPLSGYKVGTVSRPKYYRSTQTLP